MSQLLIETIRCVDGRLLNLKFHQQRFDFARKESFGTSRNISLSEIIKIPKEAQNGLFRCRMLYAKNIKNIEFLPHSYRQIKSLKLVEDNQIDYHLKFADRERLNRLFNIRGDCDDILIIKNNCITDSYAANPVFRDGTAWWTPDTPLLPGTQRARLLEEGKIKSCRITINDLKRYTKVGLINAMQDLENMPIINIGFVY